MSTNIYPNQTRTIDPYEEYNSNIVSRITESITRGTNCLLSAHACDVTIDSTSPQTYVNITEGILFKDDILISIDDEFRVNMEDSAFYIDSTSSGYWNEEGYYWILADYTYTKCKPPHQLSIKILKPSQTSIFTTGYMFLKAVKVHFTSIFEIESVHDIDPIDITGNGKRIYSQIYAGYENSIPSFNQSTDEAKIIYDKSKENLHFGTSEYWESFDAVKDNIDTTGCVVGEIGMLNSSGKIIPAITTIDATNISSCVILKSGEIDSGGKVKLYGKCENVLIESGNTINVGDKLYLSYLESGRITNNIPPYTIVPFIGVAISDSTSSMCDIWFTPYMLWGAGLPEVSWATESYVNKYDYFNIIIDDTDSDYTTLADYIADSPTAGDKVLIKNNQTVSAKITFYSSVEYTIAKGVIFSCTSGISTLFEFGDNVTIRGQFYISVSLSAGTITNVINVNATRLVIDDLKVEKAGAGTITNVVAVESAKSNAYIRGSIYLLAGTITNKISMAGANSCDIVLRDLGVTNTIDRAVDVQITDGGTGASTAPNALLNLGFTATADQLNRIIFAERIKNSELVYESSDMVTVTFPYTEPGGTSWTDVTGIDISKNISAGGHVKNTDTADDPEQWYYIYMLNNTVIQPTNLSGFIATKSSSGESGSTLIGAIYNDSTGDIRCFYQFGKKIFWDEPVFISDSVNPYYHDIDLSIGMPEISRNVSLYAKISCCWQIAGTDAELHMYVRPNGSTSDNQGQALAEFDESTAASAENDCFSAFGRKDIITDNNQIIECKISASTASGSLYNYDIEIYVTGYYIR